MTARANLYRKLAMLGVVGLFLALASRSVLAALKVPEWLDHGLSQVGDALIIAAILPALVDKAAKIELLSDFATEVSHHIIGHHLPADLRNHVLRYLTVDFYRPLWEITYRIDPLVEHPGYIKLTTLNTYQLNNASSVKKIYPYAYAVEKSWFEEVGRSEILSFALTARAACRQALMNA
jgi:hypothetical protein